ncbi:proline-specific peptidase [Lactarius vividus]|nr:proline-specific peptidase [Lactarius vividus]
MASNSVTFVVGSETFQTSYTINGDLKSGTRPHVVLNDGPGLPHWYMLPHADLHKTHCRPIVPYYQPGTGKFTRVCDKPAGFFFTPALCVAKLDNLIRDLRIERDFDPLWHSWGHLILTNGGTSYPLWRAAPADLRSRWPQDYRDMMSRHRREGTTDAREYQEGLMRFYRKHALNFQAYPPETTKSLMQTGEDPTVHRTMYACSSFPAIVLALLKDWSVIPKPGKVSCPKPIINGADDAVQDSCVAPLFYGIEKAKWVTLGSSSHTAFWE